MSQPKTKGRFRSALDLLINGVPVTANEFIVGSGISVTSDSGQTVNQDSMLKLSAVWACTRLLSSTIATLPLNLYERMPDGRRRAATNHPLYVIIHSRPNVDTTAALHWEATVAAMLLRGNGRAEKLIFNDRVVGLRFLPPDRLWYNTGKNVYVFTDYDGTRRDIPADRMFNIPGFSLDGYTGLSVVSYGANVFGNAMSADNVANATFKNGLTPTTAIEYPQLLTENQRGEARESLQTLAGAANSGKSIVLESGVKVHAVGINPKDSQLLESRAFSVEEICRWFAVPPFMVGHSEKSTSWGTGIEQQMIGFLTFGLRPWLTRIEQAINKDLLTPAEQTRYYAEFSVEGLLRGDSKARAEFYSSALRNGWMNRDQVSEKENMPPIPGGDIYTVEAGLVELAQLRNVKNETV